MRISDWSSDVCSSDLPAPHPAEPPRFEGRTHWAGIEVTRGTRERGLGGRAVAREERGQHGAQVRDGEGLRQDRKSVVEGKSVSVRVDLGGRRIIKKKKRERKEYRSYNKNIKAE